MRRSAQAPKFKAWAATPRHPASRASQAPVSPLQALRHTLGNRALGQVIHAKLRIGRADDPLEREADRVADAVMRMPDPDEGIQSVRPAVQRQVEVQDLDEESYRETPEPIGISAAAVEEEGTVQTRPRRDGLPEITPEFELGLRNRAATGRPLPDSVRGFMERRFARDFSFVRVATDTTAARLSHQVNARAFAVGRQIFFGAGEYRLQTAEGMRLLAHELTHVAQQGKAERLQAGRSPEAPRLRSFTDHILQRSLAAAFSHFTRSCPCGEDLGNNCAHCLSNALIAAGYSELDGGVGARYRRRNGRLVCRHGRPVRAAELRDWFAGQASATHSGEPDDNNYWAVYQERRRDGQGHVVLHHHAAGAGYNWAGTGDYPSWATQDHYRW